MTKLEKVVPRHVGIILDGNRRWANRRGLPAIEGHRAGVDNFRKVVEECFSKGTEYVSAYIFSTENWARSESEVKQLMLLVGQVFKKYVDEFHERGLRVVVLGRRQNLSKKLKKIITDSEALTKDNKNGTLALCFNYGGHDEIVDATRQIIATEVSSGGVTTELFEQHLYSPDIPPIDLLIRTSGEQRLSGFMLYRAAYAELYFSSKLWPDFGAEDLGGAYNEYAKRQRRFGQ